MRDSDEEVDVEDIVGEIIEEEEIVDDVCDQTDERFLREAMKIKQEQGIVLYFSRDKARIPKREKFVGRQPLTKVMKFNPIDTYEEKRPNYTLFLTGILECGEKAVVQINDIPIFFDLKVPFYVNTKDEEFQVDPVLFSKRIAGLFDESKIKYYLREKYQTVTNPVEINIAKFRHFKFHTEPIYYLRITCSNLADRQIAIEYFNEKKNFKDFTKREMRNEDGKMVDSYYETASDDISSYYRKVCRDNIGKLKFADWGEFSDYEVTENDKFKCRHFIIDVKNYKASTGPSKDKVIECNFDIETYSNVFTQGVPRALNPDDTWNPHTCVWMICMNFAYWYQHEEIINICITDKPCAPTKNKITIICENEIEILQCFATVMDHMKPDLLIGFNSGDYDIPYIIETARLIKNRKDGVFGSGDGVANKYLLNDMLKKMSLLTDYRPFNYYNKIQIKIEATRNVEEHVLQIPGFVCLDVMNVYRKIYNTSPKYSLKFFLESEGIGTKYDLPYQKLFYIYKLASLKKRLGEDFKTFDNTKYLHKLSDFFESTLENDYTPEQIDLIKEVAKQDKSNTRDRDKYYKAAASIELSEFTTFTPQQLKVMDLNYREMEYVDEMMALAGEYCVVDSYSCHKLMLSRNVFQDKREMANMAYCNIFDCIFRADGMKVRNMIIANGQTEGIVFTNISNNDIKYTGKYPGAFVVEPDQGMYKAKPNLVEFWKSMQNCSK
jgi:DNA polymerase elongation subunit (family B)